MVMSRPDQKKLGTKIRELRKSMNLTMQQLADLVGVNYTTIYRVETGKVSPSVVLLSDIAYHLGYSITGLLEEERGRLTLIRAKDQPLVESERMALRLLMPKGIINDKISISLGKGSAGEIVDRHETPGYELSYVIRGKCVFKYGDKDHTLEQGDLVYFDGKVKHAVTALEPLEFLAIYFRD
jgi:transcriptional regulator with XRE-family HTH domain